MKNLTWQNPEQLFVAQELINKVKSKCCGIKGKEKEFKELIDKYKNEVKNKSQIEIAYKQKNIEIPFIKDGNVLSVKCKINNLPLYFIFDTGATDISLSDVEAAFMIKNNYISEKDIIGRQQYLTADGSIIEGTVINLKKIELGELELNNIKASVVKNQKAPLLLGQSVFNKMGKFEIDNEVSFQNWRID